MRENKADIQNKRILKALHHAIRKARAKTLKVVHYTLEYNHIHLLVEVESHVHLGKAMQAFGISLAKNINKAKAIKGSVYKHRYHLRKITTPAELKNVLHYIFSNGVKHKRTNHILDMYNSAIAERLLKLLYPKLALKPFPKLFLLQMELFKLLEPGKIHFKALEIQLS